MSKKFPTIMRASIIKQDIEEAACRDPNKCMIRMAVARALGIGHHYIHVDSTGVSITRRPDYREKAFLPASFVKNMLKWDRGEEIKPFTGTLKFFKTTSIQNPTEKSKKRDRARQAVRREKIKSGEITAPVKRINERSIGLVG